MPNPKREIDRLEQFCCVQYYTARATHPLHALVSRVASDPLPGFFEGVKSISGRALRSESLCTKFTSGGDLVWQLGGDRYLRSRANHVHDAGGK